jgi:hypothetical protein
LRAPAQGIAPAEGNRTVECTLAPVPCRGAPVQVRHWCKHQCTSLAQVHFPCTSALPLHQCTSLAPVHFPCTSAPHREYSNLYCGVLLLDGLSLRKGVSSNTKHGFDLLAFSAGTPVAVQINSSPTISDVERTYDHRE